MDYLVDTLKILREDLVIRLVTSLVGKIIMSENDSHSIGRKYLGFYIGSIWCQDC